VGCCRCHAPGGDTPPPGGPRPWRHRQTLGACSYCSPHGNQETPLCQRMLERRAAQSTCPRKSTPRATQCSAGAVAAPSASARPPGQGLANCTTKPGHHRRVQAPEDRSFRARKEVRSCGASLAADRTGSQGDAGARQQHDGHKVRHGAWCCGRADAGTRQRVGR